MSFPPAVWFAVHNELMECADLAEPPPPSAACSSYLDRFDDNSLFRMFHLTRPCLSFIVDMVSLKLAEGTLKEGHTAEGMVLTTLYYYAQGVSSTELQALVGISTVDSPEVMLRVSKALADLTDQFISFPLTRADRISVAGEVKRLCGIPRVLGILACLHFKVRACPYVKDSFRSFTNTLGYTSIVCQVICDFDGNIMSVDKCYVGSTPEQELWEASSMAREMEQGLHGTSHHWLIGGRGHVLSHFVLTAVVEPQRSAEVRFNQAHGRIRDVARHAAALLKGRFRCLQQLGFSQERDLAKKEEVVRACCVLHNIAKKFSAPEPPGPAVGSGRLEPLQPGRNHRPPAVKVRAEVLEARQRMIEAHFGGGGGSASPGWERGGAPADE